MLPVLAVLCPPAAVLVTESPRAAAVNVGLTLLLFVPGVVHARRAVERHAASRAYEGMLAALDRCGG